MDHTLKPDDQAPGLELLSDPDHQGARRWGAWGASAVSGQPPHVDISRIPA